MKRYAITSAILLLLTVAVFAQTDNKREPSGARVFLTGTLYDINGSVIVRARVVAYRADGKEFEGTTNEEGAYKIEVPLAVYSVVARAEGFCARRIDQFRVVNSTFGKMALDFVLEVSPCEARDLPGKKSEKKSKNDYKIIIE